MNSIAVYAVAAAAVSSLAIGWYVNEKRDAEERGAAIERAKVAAKANQNIAERRMKDAQFDKMDARQHCLDADLEWVFGDDGRSFCR